MSYDEKRIKAQAAVKEYIQGLSNDIPTNKTLETQNDWALHFAKEVINKNMRVDEACDNYKLHIKNKIVTPIAFKNEKLQNSYDRYNEACNDLVPIEETQTSLSEFVNAFADYFVSNDHRQWLDIEIHITSESRAISAMSEYIIDQGDFTNLSYVLTKEQSDYYAKMVVTRGWPLYRALKYYNESIK